MADYLIPFGVDSKPFMDELNNMDAGADRLVASVNEGAKAVEKTFKDAAGAGDQLNKTLVVNAEKAINLRNQAKTLGKELGDALNGKNVSADLSKKLDGFTISLGKFIDKASKNVKFNIDAAKLKEFETALTQTEGKMDALNTVINFMRSQLDQLDPNSDEFAALAQQVEIADQFLTGLSETTTQVNEKNKTFKQELRELKVALEQMEDAGQGGTQEFIEMAIRAGQLEDQIGDVSARVKVLASDTKYLDAGIQAVTGLTGAFTALQGAQALFGAESEEVQRVIQKVTGAMAILQGIQAVAAALNKDNALSVLFLSGAQTKAATTTTALAVAETGEAAAATVATTATKGFTAALLSNPITLVIVALVALVAAFVAFTSGSDDAEEATAKLNEALERQNELLKLDERGMKRRTDLLIAEAKARGAKESEITAIEGKALADRINNRRTNLVETKELYNKALGDNVTSAEDIKKLGQKIIEDEQDLADLENEIQIKRIDQRGQKLKEGEDASKKASEQAKATAEKRNAQAAKDAETAKQILEQQIKFTRELEDEKIKAMADGSNKERAQARLDIKRRIEDLEAEKSLSKKAQADKVELIKQLREKLKKDLEEIDKKEAADRAALAFKAEQLVNELRADGIAKEIEGLRLGYEEKKREIEDQFKDDAATRTKLLTALAANQRAAEKKVMDEFNNQALKDQENQEILEIETATKFMGDLPKVEQAKQIEILRVKVDYAKLALQALLDQGNAENSIVVLQAKKTVQDLQKALGTAIKDADKPKDFSFLDLIGMGDLGDEETKAVLNAFSKAKQAAGEITDFIVDQYQRQIDKRQEVIDQIDEDLETLEEQLETEKQLREDGFANNVDTIQKEIEAKKAAKEEEIKQQQDLQKKKANIQKAEIALDSVAQASNLITSATAIFKSLAKLGPIGVGIAIATITLMTGAFIAAKVKAFQAVNDSKQYGKGGWIDGPSHTQGGKKYVAADGSGSVRELEGKEFVTNKRSAAKYADLLEAINNDHLAGMHEDALKDMLEGMGIHLSADSPKNVLTIVRERDQEQATQAAAPKNDITADVKNINQNVSFLATKERERVDRWEDKEYFYKREGSKTTRIKKS